MACFRCFKACSADSEFDDSLPIFDDLPSLQPAMRERTSQTVNDDMKSTISTPDQHASNQPPGRVLRTKLANPFEGVRTCPRHLWQHGPNAKKCAYCGQEFGVRKRRHHCRFCGRVFHSGMCSRKDQLTTNAVEELSVCTYCHGYYSKWRMLLQKGTTVTEHGRGHSLVKRTVYFNTEGTKLIWGEAEAVEGRTKLSHLREAERLKETEIVKIDVTTGNPPGTSLLSEVPDLIKIMTPGAAMLIGLDSTDEQRKWLKALQSASYVAKSTAMIAESTGEEDRKQNLSYIQRRQLERENRIRDLKQRKEESRRSRSTDSPILPSSQPSKESNSGPSANQSKHTAQTDGGYSLPKTDDGYSLPKTHSTSQSGAAQAVVEMELHDPMVGQSQKWTVRATSTLPSHLGRNLTPSPRPSGRNYTPSPQSQRSHLPDRALPVVKLPPPRPPPPKKSPLYSSSSPLSSSPSTAPVSPSSPFCQTKQRKAAETRPDTSSLHSNSPPVSLGADTPTGDNKERCDYETTRASGSHKQIEEERSRQQGKSDGMTERLLCED